MVWQRQRRLLNSTFMLLSFIRDLLSFFHLFRCVYWSLDHLCHLLSPFVSLVFYWHCMDTVKLKLSKPCVCQTQRPLNEKPVNDALAVYILISVFSQIYQIFCAMCSHNHTGKQFSAPHIPLHPLSKLVNSSQASPSISHFSHLSLFLPLFTFVFLSFLSALSLL